MAQSDTDYYYGHGELWLGDRAADGTVATFVNFPEIDELSISLAVQRVEHMSKRSSMRIKDISVPVETSAAGKFVCSSFTASMLADYLFSSTAAVGAGTLTAVSLGTVVAGNWYKIAGDYRDITLTYIKDSAGPPVTLVNGTDYTIDLAAGMVKCLIATGTMPWKITGTSGAGTGIGLLNTRKYEKYLRFKGINLADGDNSVTVDLYKIQIEPAKELALLGTGNEPNKFEIGFEVLKDSTKSSTATFGQMGDVKLLT